MSQRRQILLALCVVGNMAEKVLVPLVRRGGIDRQCSEE
jgi:hypothetical protein